MVTMGFGGRLSTVIPEPSHRLQMLHSLVCGGVEDAKPNCRCRRQSGVLRLHIFQIARIHINAALHSIPKRDQGRHDMLCGGGD
jgi:hypothetical protein